MNYLDNAALEKPKDDIIKYISEILKNGRVNVTYTKLLYAA